nr:hypothetical protein [uncultured Actinoplanes sp.]
MNAKAALQRYLQEGRDALVWKLDGQRREVAQGFVTTPPAG